LVGRWQGGGQEGWPGATGHRDHAAETDHAHCPGLEDNREKQQSAGTGER